MIISSIVDVSLFEEPIQRCNTLRFKHFYEEQAKMIYMFLYEHIFF